MTHRGVPEGRPGPDQFIAGVLAVDPQGDEGDAD
jgi:hypothetical protein